MCKGKLCEKVYTGPIKIILISMHIVNESCCLFNVLVFWSFMHGRVVSSISGRIIQNDTLHDRDSMPALTEKLNIKVLQRLGGPNRVLANNNPLYQVSRLKSKYSKILYVTAL